MSSSLNCIVLVPEWIVPLETPPIHHGYLAISRGTVAYFGNELPVPFASTPRIEMPGVAILPGLINAHCHLEFSDLMEPIPAGDSFPSWIRSVIHRRRAVAVNSDQERELRRQAIEQGLEESYACGVRWIVDMVTSPWDCHWVEDWSSQRMLLVSKTTNAISLPKPIEVQACIEMMDAVPGRWDLQRTWFDRILHDSSCEMSSWLGLAPHAPYTTSLSVTQDAVELSRELSRVVCMHLAESRDEMAWLSHRNGPFYELLQALATTQYNAQQRSVAEHFLALQQAWRALVVHGNYLGEHELHELEMNSDAMAIVHCPRTCSHFRHVFENDHRYPMHERLAKGIRHLIGTDSRASNPDLNLWREAQFLRQHNPDLQAEWILRMITSEAAAFLGVAERVGTLRCGRPANLTAVDSYDRNAVPDTLLDALLATCTQSQPLEWVQQGFSIHASVT
jgi:cytosine/adenosine deaminase-related metal-dependent hydrolase